MKRFGIDSFKGCLTGGAIGDALGFPVEFMESGDIISTYGENGIRDFSKVKGGIHISDDTQMTLFTADGILCAVTNHRNREIANYIYAAYIDWLRTQEQGDVPDVNSISWLLNVDELHAVRSPGNTCISVLSEGRHGGIGTPVNNSKGCGGIMRVAPIGLFMESPDDVISCAAGSAAITHGNPLGFIPAAAYALIINRILRTDDDLIDCISYAVKETMSSFTRYRETRRFVDLLAKAVELAAANKGKEMSVSGEAEVIAELGGGWVAEETLAIAVYCALVHEDDFEEAVAAAVNHSGDSDSTGSLTGGILGALKGAESLPVKLLTGLELYDVINEIAQDLYKASESGSDELFDSLDWHSKYIDHSYK